MNNILEYRHDLLSGLIVFLVALPLCLGIALASGADMISGVLAGVIGGIVVGFLSGSQTAVSGPAAGMATVILEAVTDINNFQLFLTAVIIAGAIQILLGAVKAGIIADYIPSSVIKGLLAAIGMILILKQTPYIFGIDKGSESAINFFAANGKTYFTEIYYSIISLQPGAVVIGLVSILLLVFWNKIPLKVIREIPSVVAVVVIAIIINILYSKLMPNWSLSNTQIVDIPQLDGSNAFQYITNQSPSNFLKAEVWYYGFIIAVVATINSLVNMGGVDRIDPHKRHTPPNRELVAQGVGNVFCGLFGAIPIAIVIVRSTVNVNSNNKTKISAIFHGVLILASVLFFKDLINLIPLACLAAILIVTGFKLAGKKVFVESYKKGWNDFLPFIITLLAIVFTNLLLGIFVGLTAGMFFVLRNNFKDTHVNENIDTHHGEVVRLELQSQVSFLNKATIKNSLWEVPPGSKVIIDATKTNYIDHDVLEIIEDYKEVYAPEHDIQLNIIGMQDSYESHDYVQFINVLDKEKQQKLSPDDVLNLLKLGNKRFVEGKYQEKYYNHQVNATSLGQNPMAMIVSCTDSRTSPEIILDMGLGDIQTVRIAGNVINDDVLGSIEMAISKLGVKLVVVMGHSSCRAITTAVRESAVQNYVMRLSEKIKPAVDFVKKNKKTKSQEEFIDQVSMCNVKHSIDIIMRESSYIKEEIAKGNVGIVAAYQTVSDGVVLFNEINETYDI